MNMSAMDQGLRERLVATTLEWESAYGIAPAITGALSEYDAARLVGLSDAEFRNAIGQASAVQKGYDFKWDGVRYQIKANRPSGKVGSFVTLVSKAKNYDFDVLIWLLYNRYYEVKEAWSFSKEDYKAKFDAMPRVRPKQMQEGKRLF